MSEEEIKAIEKIKWSIQINNMTKEINGNSASINVQVLETALNLLEKKDKIINLMAEEFENLKLAYFKKEDGGEFMGKYRTYNKNDWKQYFERKVEE